MNNTNTTYKGIGFVGLLQIVFIVLKLLNKINWKWIWVLSPTWIDSLFVIIALVIYFGLNKFMNR